MPDSPAGLPDLTDIAEAFDNAPTVDGPADPVLYLEDLVRGNAMALNELSQRGVELKDAHSMITTMIHQEFLETVLRHLAGEGEVVAAAIRVHEQIANTVAAAKSQVTKAQLAAPLANGVRPSASLNRQGRRHGG